VVTQDMGKWELITAILQGAGFATLLAPVARFRFVAPRPLPHCRPLVPALRTGVLTAQGIWLEPRETVRFGYSLCAAG
jgi:hypothetical protein